MKIFITGSTGFVGKNLVEYYRDYEVFAHTRAMDIRESLEYFKPDIIINCAAELYKPEDMWIPNVVWTSDCLNYVKANPNTRMVQIGSSAEYGPMPRASKETDGIKPVDMYQATKGAATLLSQGYDRHYGLDFLVARPYSVYGRHEKSHRLFPRLWQAFFKGEEMKLFNGFHDFIYIDDFVRGIDMLAISTDAPRGDIVNFGSGLQHSNYEVYEVFKQAANLPGDSVKLEGHMAKAFESEIWICDTTYAKEKYKFEIKYSLEEGIKDFIKTAQY
jgi:nucleoside-diphosphate-sugar epimerase